MSVWAPIEWWVLEEKSDKWVIRGGTGGADRREAALSPDQVERLRAVVLEALGEAVSGDDV